MPGPSGRVGGAGDRQLGHEDDVVPPHPDRPEQRDEQHTSGDATAPGTRKDVHDPSFVVKWLAATVRAVRGSGRADPS